METSILGHYELDKNVDEHTTTVLKDYYKCDVKSLVTVSEDYVEEVKVKKDDMLVFYEVDRHRLRNNRLYALVKVYECKENQDGKQVKFRNNLILDMVKSSDDRVVSYNVAEFPDIRLSDCRSFLNRTMEQNMNSALVLSQKKRLSSNPDNPQILHKPLQEMLSRVYGVKQECVYSNGSDNPTKVKQDKQVFYTILDKRFDYKAGQSFDKQSANYSAVVKASLVDCKENKILKNSKYMFHYDVGESQNYQTFSCKKLKNYDNYLDLALTNEGIEKAFENYKQLKEKIKQQKAIRQSKVETQQVENFEL